MREIGSNSREGGAQAARVRGVAGQGGYVDVHVAARYGGTTCAPQYIGVI